ncbi:MAG: septum formation protein Maf [Clostridia bacterium]|nr:septum formation protein Maf [Clostridia bacterium]
MKIILASASPRRREILENLGIEFEIKISNADETCDIKNPCELVCELSRRKAQATADMLKESRTLSDDTLIIGSDSVVYCGGKILGKPENRQNAFEMLTSLSGSTHSVISGLCLIYGDKVITDFEKTDVFFDEISDKEINDYVASGECDDKAGAYAIQGKASKWIKGINGCYFNVVGLPVHLLYKMAKENGIEVF